MCIDVTLMAAARGDRQPAARAGGVRPDQREARQGAAREEEGDGADHRDLEHRVRGARPGAQRDGASQGHAPPTAAQSFHLRNLKPWRGTRGGGLARTGVSAERVLAI